MGNKIAVFITGLLGAGVGKIVGVFFISMLPIIELRGAIPVGYALNLPWTATIFCAIIGNLLPIPFILLFLDYVFNFMKKHNILKKWITKLEDKAHRQSSKVTKYEFWGLALFVAIPLPGTGAWTGALIASVIKMDKKKAFLSILLGVLIAAILITFVAYGIFDMIFI